MGAALVCMQRLGSFIGLPGDRPPISDRRTLPIQHSKQEWSGMSECPDFATLTFWPRCPRCLRPTGTIGISSPIVERTSFHGHHRIRQVRQRSI
jgi:hypothetical protein